MKLTIKITDESANFKALIKKTGLKTPAALINTAITLLDWTAQQVEAGYSLAAIQDDGTEMIKLEMAFMANVRQQAPVRLTLPRPAVEHANGNTEDPPAVRSTVAGA